MISDDLSMWVNFGANAVLTGALGLFMLYVFGRDDSAVHRLHPVKNCLLKTGLSLCSAGALYNCLTMSNPSVGEVITNVGFAAVFSWAALFHYETFMKRKPKAKSRFQKGRK